jgi:hypothetical protein
VNGSAEKLKKARAPRRKTTKRARTAKERPVSDEAIRMRAYFISEERVRLGLPGDSHSDWLEARRQLLAEIGAS